MCLTRVPEIVWSDPYGWVWLDYNILPIFYMHLNKSLYLGISHFVRI